MGTESGQLGEHFRKNIRVHNSMFTLTSIGDRVDRSINHTELPNIFRISGKKYHHIGSLLHDYGNKPQFSQIYIYIYDTNNEIQNRINTLMNDEVQIDILRGIYIMQDEHNVLIKSFCMERYRYRELHTEFLLRLLSERISDVRPYNIPTAS